VVKSWFHRSADDLSGCTFVEWDPKDPQVVDMESPPVAMIINTKELRGAGFKLQEIFPPALRATVAGRVSGRTRGAGVRQVEGLGEKKYVLETRMDNEIRELCE